MQIHYPTNALSKMTSNVLATSQPSYVQLFNQGAAYSPCGQSPDLASEELTMVSTWTRGLPCEGEAIRDARTVFSFKALPHLTLTTYALLTSSSSMFHPL